MIIKKINSVLGLLSCIGLCVHLWIMTYSLLTGWYHLTICKGSAHIICVLVILHVALTLFMFFFCHDGTSITAKKENIGTIIQRVTGLLMLLLIHNHVEAYGFIVTGEVLSVAQIVQTSILEMLFMASAVIHAMLSLPKALLTLGAVQTDRTYSIIGKISASVFGASGICSIAAMLNFLM